jgi:hypothetical protein
MLQNTKSTMLKNELLPYASSTTQYCYKGRTASQVIFTNLCVCWIELKLHSTQNFKHYPRKNISREKMRFCYKNILNLFFLLTVHCRQSSLNPRISSLFLQENSEWLVLTGCWIFALQPSHLYSEKLIKIQTFYNKDRISVTLNKLGFDSLNIE